MIRAYKLKQHSNKGKEDKILDLFYAYRKAAKLLAYKQWHLFYTTGKIDKNLAKDILRQVHDMAEAQKLAGVADPAIFFDLGCVVNDDTGQLGAASDKSCRCQWFAGVHQLS